MIYYKKYIYNRVCCLKNGSQYSLILFLVMGFCSQTYFASAQLANNNVELADIKPWKHIKIDSLYGGAWIVAGDLDGDGVTEIVSARNVDVDSPEGAVYDNHYTTAVVAHRLDGSVMWRWGDSNNLGDEGLHYDVACQIYDWDGDGKNDVIIAGKEHLIEIDGVTGKEKRRLPLPDNTANDCIVFANVSGNSRATDILIKTRYTQVWAYDRDWNQLWTVEWPGGYRTAHQPIPIDVDGDGHDEVMTGYAMINPDGSTRWVFKSKKVNTGEKGHRDSFSMLRWGESASDFRFVLTMCSDLCIACIDGNGKLIWEYADGSSHFEAVDVGKIIAGEDGLQIAVDLDHRAFGDGQLWVFNEQGEVKTKIVTDYARSHTLVDWTGDGLEEIVIASPRTLYNSQGKAIGKMEANGRGEMVATGDYTGDGVPDILMSKGRDVYIYKNEKGKRPNPPATLGTGINFSLY